MWILETSKVVIKLYLPSMSMLSPNMWPKESHNEQKGLEKKSNLIGKWKALMDTYRNNPPPSLKCSVTFCFWEEKQKGNHVSFQLLL